MENSNYSKVLRQLPEGVVRWLLQDCMVNGIPTRFKGFITGLEYDVNPFKIYLCEEFGYLYTHDADIAIYDLNVNKPICTPTEWQAPTPEQVKAIYEGVESVKCVTFEEVKKVKQPLYVGVFKEDEEPLDIWLDCGKTNVNVFEKGKGFALPISWKEEEESDLVKGQNRVCKIFDNLKQPKTVAKFEPITVHPSEIINFFLGWMQSDDLKIVDENLEEIDGAMLHGGNLFGKRFLEFISKNHKQTPDPIKDLQERVTKLEQKEQHASKEVDSGDGELKYFQAVFQGSNAGGSIWFNCNGYPSLDTIIKEVNKKYPKVNDLAILSYSEISKEMFEGLFHTPSTTKER